MVTGDPHRAYDDDTPVFVISVAAELAGMHAQTLRQYDRLGLVIPTRTRGGGRRYSHRDVTKLREIQRLSQEEGVSLPGISRIMELENKVEALESRLTEVLEELEAARRVLSDQRGGRVFAAGARGEVVAVNPGQRPRRSSGPSQAVVVWRPRP